MKRSTSKPISSGRSRRSYEPVSDTDIAVADSLKVLDLKRPIREADVEAAALNFCYGPEPDFQCWLPRASALLAPGGEKSPEKAFFLGAAASRTSRSAAPRRAEP